MEYGKKAATSPPCGEGVRKRTRECKHPRQNCPKATGNLDPLNDYVPCFTPCKGTIWPLTFELFTNQLFDFFYVKLKLFYVFLSCLTLSEEFKWDEWQAWSTCSKTCGNGKSVRRRFCTEGSQGNNCPSPNQVEERVCVKCACPKVGIFYLPRLFLKYVILSTYI